MNLQMNYQIENLPFVDYSSCYFPKGRFNICSAQVPGYKMVNMLPSGKTPFLRLGYKKPRWRPPKNGEAQGNLYKNWLMASNLVDFFSPIRTKSSQLTQPPVGLSFLANPRSHQLLHDLGLPSLRIPWPCCLLASKRKKQLCRAWSKRARLRLVPRLWWNLVASPIWVSRQMVQMPWWPWLLIVAWKIFVGVRPELTPQQKDPCFREILRWWPDSMDILAAKWCVENRFVLWPGELCKLQCCFHILRHACFILHIFPRLFYSWATAQSKNKIEQSACRYGSNCKTLNTTNVVIVQ
jgi:hypothetical protein